MRKTTTAFLLLVAIALIAPSPAFSWGFKGHRVVAEVADQIIARDHPELHQRLRDILKGKRLSDVAVYADCAVIPFCESVPSGFFKAFLSRNRESNKYHYTDVPVQRKSYAAKSAGTHVHDVVQILRYSVGRLRGSPPADVPANLRQDEAVWMMVHLVGDIHQPLHVGAVYFDRKCAVVINPEDLDDDDFIIGTTVTETHGGNWLKISKSRQLHKLWDSEAVDDAMRLAGVKDGMGSIEKFASIIVANPPTAWETPGDPSTWSRRWANEILPLAREAHARISIALPGEDQNETHKVECRWNIQLPPDYEEWAAQHAREQLAKAGFRLAAMLRMVLEDD